MRTPRLGNDQSIELKMTPMIDVVFLLLVFFVWTSSFQLPEFDLPSSIAVPPAGSLLSSSQAIPEAFDELVIRLARREDTLVITLNGRSVADKQELADQLREILSIGVQPPVIIHPDDDVSMDRAVAVYDVARQVGVDRVLFAAAAP